MNTSKTQLLITFLIILSFYKLNAQNKNEIEWANKGSVTQNNYITEIPFNYIDGYIFIDIIQNSKTYNFLFDTGAEATVIDKSIIKEFDIKSAIKSKVSGPLIENQNVNTILISSLHISEIEFVNTGAIAIDLNFSKSKFCKKLDGIIGNNLMKKANWQIDYQNKKIRFSDDLSKFNLTKREHKIKMSLKNHGFGTETVALNIDGIKSNFNLDTGSGRSKFVAPPKEFKKLVKNNKNTSLKYGLSKSNTDYKVITENIIIGDIILKNQIVNLENEVGKFKLVGNRFLENYLVTIDWKNHFLYLMEKKDIIPEKLLDFKLNFTPNFKTNKIEVKTGLKKFTTENEIKKGTILSHINGINITDLSDNDFCIFWNSTWKEIMKMNTINITLLCEGNYYKHVLAKEDLLML